METTHNIKLSEKQQWHKYNFLKCTKLYIFFLDVYVLAIFQIWTRSIHIISEESLPLKREGEKWI